MNSMITSHVLRAVRMMRRRRFAVATAILVVLVGCYLGLSYFVVAASLKVKPPICPYRTPVGEEIRLVAGDGVPIVAWLFPSSSDRAIVLVHGISSFAWDGAAPDIARAYVEEGFHVLVFDGRGHGGSGGEYLGLGWDERRDVRAAVDFLLTRGFRPGSIGLHGTSYGAATALLSTAVIPEVGAVVADSAFADVRDLMDREIEKSTGVPARIATFLRPGLSLVAQAFYALDFEVIRPERAVPAIAPRPIFLIHGGEDDVIPPEHSYRLRDAYHNPADEFWIIPGLGHTEAVRLQRQKCGTRSDAPTRGIYLDRVTAFFDRSLR